MIDSAAKKRGENDQRLPTNTRPRSVAGLSVAHRRGSYASQTCNQRLTLRRDRMPGLDGRAGVEYCCCGGIGLIEPGSFTIIMVGK